MKRRIRPLEELARDLPDDLQERGRRIAETLYHIRWYRTMSDLVTFLGILAMLIAAVLLPNSGWWWYPLLGAGIALVIALVTVPLHLRIRKPAGRLLRALVQEAEENSDTAAILAIFAEHDRIARGIVRKLKRLAGH